MIMQVNYGLLKSTRMESNQPAIYSYVATNTESLEVEIGQD